MTVLPLKGVVQHYPWGGKSFLPGLLNLVNKNDQPFAEYWLGAHDNAPSLLANGHSTKLNDHIAAMPSVLGELAEKKFGRLPYLLKVLDVKDMLSIQVHPSKQNAESGFDREESLGISRNAANRNYKDTNHKPELAMALSEFHLLHGFRPVDSLVAVLESVPELTPLVSVFSNGDYRALYGHVMNLSQPEVDQQLQPLVDRIIPLYEANTLEKADPNFWAARAAITYKGAGVDRGIYSVYFFNLVHMQRGEAIFQDAGLPHAYLEGQNIEIMANSDNVLRGGLTNKFVDVPELMKHVHFVATVPAIMNPEPDPQTHERIFKTPAADFELSEIHLEAEESYHWHPSSVEIALVFSGEVLVDDQTFRKGEAMALMAGQQASLYATAETTLYKATVPY